MTDQTRMLSATPQMAAPGVQPSDAFSFPSRKTLFIGLGGGILLLCATIGLTLLLHAGDSPAAWVLTRDQQRVYQEFGPPQAFTLAFASDLATATAGNKEPPLVRMETWEYPTVGASFTFRNGVYKEWSKVAIPKQRLKSPALAPDAFIAGMTPGQVSRTVGAKPDTTAQVLAETVPGLTVESYRGQIAAGFQDGKLVTVRMIALVPSGGGN
jgi:hypothetical protein